MHNKPERWTLDGFLNHFQAVHETMPEYQFGWIIGAGASKSSGIPTGGELVDWWLKDMHLRECQTGQSLDQWATAETLEIDQFQYADAAASYPMIYGRRFKDFPEEGFAFLEHVMTGNSKSRGDQGLAEVRPTRVIEPGPGYSILAKIMETQRHRVVITTNFDNLLADALQIYTSTYPFVCGHESLTEFVRVAMRRPVICKIHRDLLLAPFNDTRKLRLLHEAWSATLRSLLRHYTPVVIGYGGNDDSLMERLHSLERDEIKGRLVWCYYEGSDKQSEPSQRIQNLVGELNGVLVPVPDFDRLMILLGARIGIQVLDVELEQRQKARTNRYRDSVMEMKTDDLPQLTSALFNTYRQAGWWWWQVKAEKCLLEEEKEVVYREAIKIFPNVPELAGIVADFMTDVRNDHDEAERLYRLALALDPENADITCNLAIFMTDIRQDHDEAEKMYRLALALDPKDAIIAGNLAGFLIVHDRIDEAEPLVRRALSLNNGQPTQLLAEVLVYQCIIAVRRGNDFTAMLVKLKDLLLAGFERGKWSFDALFESNQAKIPKKTLSVLKAYSAAVLDADLVAGLDKIVKQIHKKPVIGPSKPPMGQKRKRRRGDELT